jgi:hypothetical protein
MDAIDYTCHEFLAHGSDMNQRYQSSAVYLENVGESPPPPSDSTLYHEPHTFPGLRLPHAWVNTATPGTQISTLDLAGKGKFALFTGNGGNAWLKSAETVQKALGVDIAAYSIGYGEQYEAVYNEWYHLREVDEDGCVLVRPDNFIAWRSVSVAPNCDAVLLEVMRKILSL